MREISPAAAGLLLLAGAVCLVGLTGPERTVERLGQLESAAVERQLEHLGLELAEEAPAAFSGTSPPSETPPASAAPEPVPVETVLEPWGQKAEEASESAEEMVPTPEPEAPEMPVSAPTEGLELTNATEYQVDLRDLPDLPGDLNLDTKEPVVLIVHTHATESYDQSPGYRSEDPDEGVMAAGDALASALEARGYGVVHDKTLCDRPDFNDAYNVSRQVIEKNLAQYPSICLVLDVHRDAAEDMDGSQVRMAAVLDGIDTARLMLVVGTDDGGLNHPLWRQNLSLATVLQGTLEGQHPGLMRPINLRSQRFNQDLGPMALLVEVGSSGCTQDEANRAAAILGEGISQVLELVKP